MSLCCLRLLLALLIGAGLLGRLPASVLAGEKIEFSRASETLAMPVVDRPESEPAEAFSLMVRNSSPPPPMLFPMATVSVAAPVRRNDDLNSRIGNGGLSSDLDRLGRNNTSDSPYWELGAGNYSAKPASNYFNDLSTSGTWENPDGLGSGMERLEARNGQANARLDSLTPSERRDRQNNLGPDNAGNRTWKFRSDDAYSPGNESSLNDLLKDMKQNNASRGSKPGLFKQDSSFSDPKSPFAKGSLSLMPSASSLISPLDATETGESVYKMPSAHASSLDPLKPPDKQDEGFSHGLPGLSAWGDVPGFSLEAPKPAMRKPPGSQSQIGPQRQQGGAVLPWPKQPNAVFK
ncbi:MAG: hypothetical protein ABSG04_01585 [Verrucomicrobiota bacterium]|jgi:hypothetical protein